MQTLDINISKTLIISSAVKALKAGGLIIIPTDTTYGIVVDANNPNAIANLLNYKNRKEGKSLPIAVYNKEMASKYVSINETASNIFDNYLPGAITVVCNSKKVLDERLEAENSTLGVRIPNYRLILEIIHSLGNPVVCTSPVNEGMKTPYSVDDIWESQTKENLNLVELVIDAGKLPKNPPSTVIDSSNDDIKIYRKGRVDPTKFKHIKEYTVNSIEETIEIGKSIILENKLSTFLINGELGAGKTHLTKGIALGLGIDKIIKSPTYNYVTEIKMDGNSKFYHFDAWRINSIDDLKALRFYDWFTDNNKIVIEWPTIVISLDENFFEGIEYIFIDIIIINETSRLIKVFQKI